LSLCRLAYTKFICENKVLIVIEKVDNDLDFSIKFILEVSQMKSIYLKETLTKIEGHVVSGNDNLLIKNAVTTHSGLNHNTMYFHLHKNKVREEVFNQYQSIVAVTEDPECFQMLKQEVVIVHVKDIERAYWKFVDYYRSLFDIPIIGITGTSGKTTTKEMIKHLLSKKYKVQATFQSNNSIYMNLPYLLGINDHTEAAVFEMGVDWPGNLLNSCQYFKPQIRILLNIGVYHLVGCKTPEGYIKAKSEILHGMDQESDILILNADDDNIKKIDVSPYKRKLYFGFSEHADFKAKNVEKSENGTLFTLTYKNEDTQIFVPGLGTHNVYNALASLAAVIYAGIDFNEAVESLKTFKHLEKHMELRDGPNECIVLDDNWNNTPPSMESALKVLKEIGETKKKIAILGFMYNLGNSSYAREEYRKMGKVVVEAEVDYLFIIGDRPKEIGMKAIELGMDKSKVYFLQTGNEILKALNPLLSKDTVVLLKAPDDHVSF
jgi:UDP-N-acetylmuramoyl-tripeptide--D-alanyl-D-alanine ligase